MPMFVTKDRVPVADGENTIFIKVKMDYGTRNAVLSDATAVQMNSTEPSGSIDIGAYQTALLVHNITGWQGPAFAGMACTRDNILTLDPDEPLVQQVLEEINRRNTPQAPVPNSPDATALLSPATASMPADAGTRT